MKLSEYKGEEALEVLADIIEPAATICADTELVNILRGGGRRIAAIQRLLREHKRSVIEILAAMDRVPADEYEVNILTLPIRMLEILNDEELMRLFTSQGQSAAAALSGSVLENTGDPEE